MLSATGICHRARALLAIGVVAALGSGCGSHSSRTHAAGRPSPARAGQVVAEPAEPSIYGGPAPLLVYFKRAVSADPVASQLIVDVDGRASALVTLGGINGEKKHVFVMDPGQLQRLRRLLTHTRLRDTTCCDTRYYIYWVTAHGRTWRLQQRRVPPSMRPLIHALDAITDAHTGYR